jgi:hypothetical protein
MSGGEQHHLVESGEVNSLTSLVLSFALLIQPLPFLLFLHHVKSFMTLGLPKR